MHLSLLCIIFLRISYGGGQYLIIIHSKNVRTTLAIGRTIGALAYGGIVIAFKGDLGAGKTTMAKGIAQGLGIWDTITSPTFTIINEYIGRLKLAHIDAYRLADEEEFVQTGGEELLGAPDTVCLVEWSERIARLLPEQTQTITIHVDRDDTRIISLEGTWLESLDVRRWSIRS